jgi:hypothetical protein
VDTIDRRKKLLKEASSKVSDIAAGGHLVYLQAGGFSADALRKMSEILEGKYDSPTPTNIKQVLQYLLEQETEE